MQFASIADAIRASDQQDIVFVCHNFDEILYLSQCEQECGANPDYEADDPFLRANNRLSRWESSNKADYAGNVCFNYRNGEFDGWCYKDWYMQNGLYVFLEVSDFLDSDVDPSALAALI